MCYRPSIDMVYVAMSQTLDALTARINPVIKNLEHNPSELSIHVYPSDIRLPFNPINSNLGCSSIDPKPAKIMGASSFFPYLFHFLPIFQTSILGCAPFPTSFGDGHPSVARPRTFRRFEAAPSNAGIAEAARRLRARRSVTSWVPGQPYHSAAVKRLVSWPWGSG